MEEEKSEIDLRNHLKHILVLVRYFDKKYSRKQQEELVEILINKGVSVNEDLSKQKLHNKHSLWYSCKELIPFLLKHGAKVDVIRKYPNGEQQSLFHHFASEQSLECMKQILEMGADINALNHRNETPLHCLLKIKDEFEPRYDEIFKWMVLNGAHLFAKDKNDETPMQLVFRNETQFFLLQGNY